MLIHERARHIWSLDELHAAVREDIPSADFSTVFRATALLERRGEISRVDLGDGKARYEPPGLHHEHITCTSCGTVAEVPGCVLDEMTPRVEARTRYRVTSHQVVFSGLCPDCAPKRRAGRRRVAASGV